MSRFIAAQRLFDFDHARAGVGEKLGAERSGEDAGEIGNDDPIECAGALHLY